MEINEWNDLFPESTESQKQNGWTIEYSFLQAVQRAVEERGEPLALESVESVLLSAFALIRKTYFAN